MIDVFNYLVLINMNSFIFKLIFENKWRDFTINVDMHHDPKASHLNTLKT